MKKFQNVQSKLKQENELVRPGTASTVRTKQRNENEEKKQIAFGRASSSHFNKQHLEDKENINPSIDNEREHFSEDEDHIKYYKDEENGSAKKTEKHKNYGKIPSQ